ncbi:MAG TPA: hypothetical protein DCS93_33880, partial [Microscillaceae bacterium]|nr:hypothetical protein [Microscillaceae bacterium]
GGNCGLPVAVGDFNHAAMNHTDYDNSQACGACAEVTSKATGRSVIVKIVDRCPECKPGDIDLTQQMFAKIDNPTKGRIAITWKYVPCPLKSNSIKLHLKTGTSIHWTAFQLRNLRYAVAKLEYKKGNKWINIKREPFNFFIETKGIASSATLRATSVLGEQLIFNNIFIPSNAGQAVPDYDTKKQFKNVNGGGNNGGGGNPGQVIANGTYFLGSVTNGQHLVDKRNENNVRMTGANGAFAAQKWTLKHVGNNVYTLKNQGTGRYLEVPFAKCSDGANVNTWTNANGSHKRWQIIKHGNQYELKPIHCLDKSLDRDFGDRTKNGNVHLYNDANNNNQRWKITSVNSARTTRTVITFDQEVTVYPNPVNNDLHIKGVQAGEKVVILNQLGQPVWNTTLAPGQAILSIRHLPAGVYVLKAENAQQVLRIIKK